MKIAVTSQDRQTVTGHAGRCRNFWVFTVDDRGIVGKELLELALEQSFHESQHDAPHPLDGIDVLITGGMGPGLVARLGRKGIRGLVTRETDPGTAVLHYLDGTLVAEPATGGPHHH